MVCELQLSVQSGTCFGGLIHADHGTDYKLGVSELVYFGGDAVLFQWLECLFLLPWVLLPKYQDIWEGLINSNKIA